MGFVALDLVGTTAAGSVCVCLCMAGQRQPPETQMLLFCLLVSYRLPGVQGVDVPAFAVCASLLYLWAAGRDTVPQHALSSLLQARGRTISVTLS